MQRLAFDKFVKNDDKIYDFIIIFVKFNQNLVSGSVPLVFHKTVNKPAASGGFSRVY